VEKKLNAVKLTQDSPLLQQERESVSNNQRKNQYNKKHQVHKLDTQLLIYINLSPMMKGK
jgi:hypothetical protein